MLQAAKARDRGFFCVLRRLGLEPKVRCWLESHARTVEIGCILI